MNKKRGLFKFWGIISWLKHEGAVLWRALIDKETPLPARLAALGVILYVVSPIDIIPDFIPFLGFIDDLIIIPIGFAVVRALVPEAVWLRAGGEIIGRDGRRVKDVTPRGRV